MNPTEFQNLAASAPPLRDFLNQTGLDSGLYSPPKQFATGLEPLGIWACYALFRWSKMILDARARSLELDAVRQQIELIQELVADGWLPEQANAIVPTLLDGLKARKDDAGFQQALQKALNQIST